MRPQVVKISSPPADVPIKVQWVNQNPKLGAVFFIDQNTGWAAGEQTLLSTCDGGKTWIAQDLGVVGDPMSIQFLDRNTGWIPTSWGLALLATSDGGKTWTSVPKPADVNFYQTQFVDAKTGWAASNDAMYKTTDGKTWQAVGDDVPRRPFFFVDASHGWAATKQGDIAASTDGGSTWHVQKANQTLPILSIFFLDRNHGWASRYNGVMTTTDGGQNWQPPQTSAELYLGSVLFLDANTGWAIGQNQLFHTLDGGRTWELCPGPSGPAATAIFFLDATTGWYTTQAGTIVVTKDGGKTWATQNAVPPFNPGKAIRGKDYTGKPRIPQVEYGDGYSFTKILFANKNTGWAIGTLSGGAEGDPQGLIGYTQNGGKTWTTELLNDQPYDMYFSPQGTGSIYTKGYFAPTQGVFHPLTNGRGPWLTEFEFTDGKSITLAWTVALRGNTRVTVKAVEFSPGTNSNFGPLPLKGLSKKSNGKSCLRFAPAKLGILPGTKLRFRICLEDPDGIVYTHEIGKVFVHRR